MTLLWTGVQQIGEPYGTLKANQFADVQMASLLVSAAMDKPSLALCKSYTSQASVLSSLQCSCHMTALNVRELQWMEMEHNAQGGRKAKDAEH